MIQTSQSVVTKHPVTRLIAALFMVIVLPACPEQPSKDQICADVQGKLATTSAALKEVDGKLATASAALKEVEGKLGEANKSLGAKDKEIEGLKAKLPKPLNVKHWLIIDSGSSPALRVALVIEGSKALVVAGRELEKAAPPNYAYTVPLAQLMPKGRTADQESLVFTEELQITMESGETKHYTLQGAVDIPQVQLSVTSPSDGETVTSNTVPVSLIAAPDAQVTVNGKRVKLKKGGVGTKKIKFKTQATFEIDVRAKHRFLRPAEAQVTLTRSLSEKERMAAFKYGAKSIRGMYRQLQKNADRHIGMKVCGRGQIFNTDEGYDVTVFQVNVRSEGYGFWTDNTMFRFNGTGTDKCLDDVVADICGTVAGDYNYQSVAGYNITVPLVDIEFIKCRGATYTP